MEAFYLGFLRTAADPSETLAKAGVSNKALNFLTRPTRLQVRRVEETCKLPFKESDLQSLLLKEGPEADFGTRILLGMVSKRLKQLSLKPVDCIQINEKPFKRTGC